jgi:type IV pilus assembly protein PilA
MKKRGFTLIELLAVILILGVIALIAIPVVNNILKESRKSAFAVTAANVVSAMESACQVQQIKGETLTTSYTFTDGVVSPSLNIKGKLPTSGTATIDSTCKVTLSVTSGIYAAMKDASEESASIIDISKYNVIILLIGNQEIMKGYDGQVYADQGVSALDTEGKNLTSSVVTTVKKNGTSVTMSDILSIGIYDITYTVTKYGKTYTKNRVITIGYPVYVNGTAVYFNPVSGAKCTAGEAVSTTGTKTGCMKWYTFNDDGMGSDKINLILDHNTTATVAWASGGNVSGPTTIITKLVSDTGAWLGVPTRTDSYSVSNGTATYTINYSTYRARLIAAGEVSKITGNSSFVESTTPSTNWFYLNSNNQTQTATTTGTSTYAWLFDYTNGCTSYGCNIADSSTSGYWTSTAMYGRTDRVWCVDKGGSLSCPGTGIGGFNGVRPVITISKSVLQ